MTNTIVAFLEDLFILPRIEDVATHAGFRLMPVSSPDDLGITGDPIDRPIPLTEPLEGPDAILVLRISELQPALILIDAGSQRLPWARWIQVLKTSAATRRIPILVFGPHVQSEMLESASALGADVVVSRGVFHRQMADRITRHSRPARAAAFMETCQGELAEQVREGIALHNQGAYYEAHELLEQAWMEASEMEGYLYRAILQLTVTCLHLDRGNMRGARKMLLRIRQWLDPLPDVCRQVDVADMKQQVSFLREALHRDPVPSNLRPTRIRLVS